MLVLLLLIGWPKQEEVLKVVKVGLEDETLVKLWEWAMKDGWEVACA